jgi:hypothetical protein
MANAQVLVSTRVEWAIEQWACDTRRKHLRQAMPLGSSVCADGERWSPGLRARWAVTCQRSSGQKIARVYLSALAHRVAARPGHSGAREIFVVSGGGEGMTRANSCARTTRLEKGFCDPGHQRLRHSSTRLERCCCNNYGGSRHVRCCAESGNRGRSAAGLTALWHQLVTFECGGGGMCVASATAKSSSPILV